MVLKMKTRGIGFKLALIMLCVTLLGIVITTGVSIIIAGNVIIDETLAKIENATRSEALDINNWLSKHKTQINTLADALSRLDDYSMDYLRPIFQAQTKSDPVYTEIYMGFPDDTAVMGGRDQALMNELYDGGWKPTQRGWYKLALTDAAIPHITAPYLDVNTGDLCITAVRAVVDSGGKTVGVAGADILINVVQELTDRVTLNSKDGYAMLLDSNGDILVHHDPDYAPDAEGNFKNLATVKNGVYAKLWEQISGSDTTVKYKDSFGKMKYYTASALESTNWELVTVLPVGDVNAPITTLVAVVIPMTLVLIALAGVIILREINIIVTKPLNMIIDKITGSTKMIHNSANQFNELSESLATGSSRQAAAIEETSATMNETSSMVAQNAENTKAASQIATNAMNEVNEAGRVMGELMATMSELKESSDRVSKIVKTIDDIAFQTNLLAINATVEAARAGGDAGRSFAVVAQEVRDLAKRSANASKETAEIIEHNITLTDSSRTGAEKVGTIAGSNAKNISDLAKLINEINAASEEQANGIKQINIAMSQTEKVTQENAAVAEQNAATSSSMQDEITNLEEAVEIAESLAGK